MPAEKISGTNSSQGPSSYPNPNRAPLKHIVFLMLNRMTFRTDLVRGSTGWEKLADNSNQWFRTAQLVFSSYFSQSKALRRTNLTPASKACCRTLHHLIKEYNNKRAITPHARSACLPSNNRYLVGVILRGLRSHKVKLTSLVNSSLFYLIRDGTPADGMSSSAILGSTVKRPIY
jgi:hypothetical protein